MRRILPSLGIVAIGILLSTMIFTTLRSIESKNAGQGLAIARSVVVDRHGGTLRFASEVGKGTAFFIRLPLDESKALAARAVSA